MRIEDDNIGRLAMIWLVSSANPQLREQMEDQLRELTEVNNAFTKEYFYSFFALQNKPVALRFIPGTISFMDYGSDLVVMPIFSEDQRELMTNNIIEHISSFGLIRAEDITDTLQLPMKNKLKVTGFNTRHVMEVLFR